MENCPIKRKSCFFQIAFLFLLVISGIILKTIFGRMGAGLKTFIMNRETI